MVCLNNKKPVLIEKKDNKKPVLIEKKADVALSEKNFFTGMVCLNNKKPVLIEKKADVASLFSDENARDV